MGKIDTNIDASFTLGGINFFEDPHFSYFYLSQSLDVNTKDIYPGYSEIIALYLDGTESYFIKRNEAKVTADWILNRMLSNQEWFIDILNRIEGISSSLKTLSFDTKAQYSISELSELYANHCHLNLELYKVARIPEALDRGDPYFTNYLKNYLTEIGCTASELPELFNSLTTICQGSVFAQERKELNLIRQEIFQNYPNIQNHYSPIMVLSSKLRKSLIDHTERWATMHYHGYRNPRLLSETDFMNRILFEKCEIATPQMQVPISTFQEFKIDNKHKILFYLFSEIGRVKIYRRFCQLSAFYYLDNLLVKIAEKFNSSELLVRHCLPSEIKGLLAGKITIDKLMDRATNKCGMSLKKNSVTFFYGDALKQAINFLNTPKSNIENSNMLFGQCVSLGKVTGRVRKVDNLYSQEVKIFPGDILVCQALDPDFLPFLTNASGVVTEQGGVTSHGAIICRELNIPTISGVANILDIVNENDLIEIDAYKEFVRLIEKEKTQSALILVDELERKNVDIVGNKSANLLIAKELGIKVPEFYILDFDSIMELYQKDTGRLADIVKELCVDLASNANATFLLRSSCTFEDSPRHFYAGYFRSYLLNKENPTEALKSFIEFNRQKGYQGSVILQEFLNAQYCGVCMIGDMNSKNSQHLIIEYSKGAINHATLGNAPINRIIYDTNSEEFIEDGIILNNSGNSFQFDFISWYKIIESKIPRPTYIEWGYKDREFFLYQLRFKQK